MNSIVKSASAGSRNCKLGWTTGSDEESHLACTQTHFLLPCKDEALTKVISITILDHSSYSHIDWRFVDVDT
jgi:hypothetical protein